jgi:hypothetical protein
MRKAPFVRLALAKGSLEDPAENDLQPLSLSFVNKTTFFSTQSSPLFNRSPELYEKLLVRFII